MNKHPDSVFGPDVTPALSIDALLDQIKKIQPRALTTAALEDTVTLIEYMRDTAVEMYEGNVKLAAELDEREQKIRQREEELTLKGKALEAALRTADAARTTPAQRRFRWRM